MKKCIFLICLLIYSPVLAQDPEDVEKTEVAKDKNDLWSVLELAYASFTSLEIKVTDVYNLMNRGIITQSQGIQIIDRMLKLKKDSSRRVGSSFEQDFVFSFSDLISSFSYTYLLILLSPAVLFYACYLARDNIRFTIFFIIICSVNYFLFSIYFYLDKAFLVSTYSFAIFNFFLYALFLTICRFKEDFDPFFDFLLPFASETKIDFYLKLLSSFLLIFSYGFFSFVFLRHLLNYIIFYGLLYRSKRLFEQFTSKFLPDPLQPFTLFLSILYGFVILISSNVLYVFGSPRNGDLNSFIYLANFSSFAYLNNLSLFIQLQQQNYGKTFNEKLKDVSYDSLDKEEMFQEAINKSDLVKVRLQSFTVSEDKYKINCFRLDLLIVPSCLLLYVIGVVRSTQYLVLLSLYFYVIISNQIFTNYTIRISRILTGIFYLVFITGFVIFDVSNISFIKDVQT